MESIGFRKVLFSPYPSCLTWVSTSNHSFRELKRSRVFDIFGKLWTGHRTHIRNQVLRPHLMTEGENWSSTLLRDNKMYAFSPTLSGFTSDRAETEKLNLKSSKNASERLPYARIVRTTRSNAPPIEPCMEKRKEENRFWAGPRAYIRFPEVALLKTLWRQRNSLESWHFRISIWNAVREIFYNPGWPNPMILDLR